MIATGGYSRLVSVASYLSLPCLYNIAYFRGLYGLVYTRVLTRAQLTSGCELSSNPPIDVG